MNTPILMTNTFGFVGNGMPDAIRTHDLQSRSLTLYPTELQAHILIYYSLNLRNCQVSWAEFEALSTNYSNFFLKILT